MRRGANRWKAPIFSNCSDCGATIPSHIACPSCGTYRGRKVLEVEAF